MKDLTDPRWIHAKGALLLLAGGLACVGILLELPSLRIALLLGIAVWSFARFYYYAFYVIEHYVDPGFRFSGLGSFALYLLRRRSAKGSGQA